MNSFSTHEEVAKPNCFDSHSPQTLTNTHTCTHTHTHTHSHTCTHTHTHTHTHTRQQNIAAECLVECQTALRLGSLTRTPSVSDAQFCQCCSQLFQRLARSDDSEYAELREGLAGHHLSVSTYFSASPDGKLRVPWNFELHPRDSIT